jgi:hypothetical protein
MSQYLISISISELQHWLADDIFPVLIGRISHSKIELDEKSSEFELERIFKCLPAFSVDDPAGVLVVEVAGPGSWGADEDPSVRQIELSSVKRFIPLTEDARAALSVNWSSVFELSPAIFEKQFELFRLRKKQNSANKAGNLFARAFISMEPNGYTVNGFFVRSLIRAIMAAEHKREDDVEKILAQQTDDFYETWIERAFRYTRHKRFDKALNFKSFYDVGVLLSDVDAVKELMDSLREICRRLEGTENSYTRPLAFFCADAELSLLEVKLNVGQEIGSTISLLTLALFLRWKQSFHDQRSVVNPQLIMDDVSSLVGVVDVESVENALWMMGAYLGMENIAPIHRYLNQEKYPTLRFSGKEGRIAPIPAWSISKIEPLREALSSTDPVQTIEPSSISDVQLNNNENTEANEELSPERLEQGESNGIYPVNIAKDNRDNFATQEILPESRECGSATQLGVNEEQDDSEKLSPAGLGQTLPATSDAEHSLSASDPEGSTSNALVACEEDSFCAREPENDFRLVSVTQDEGYSSQKIASRNSTSKNRKSNRGAKKRLDAQATD